MNKNKFIPYFGSKRKETDIILPYVYPSKKTIDVFGGSGSVGISIKQEHPTTLIYNDVNENLIELIKVLKKNNKNLVKNWNKNTTIKTFKTKNDAEKFLNNKLNKTNDDLKYIVLCLYSHMNTFYILDRDFSLGVIKQSNGSFRLGLNKIDENYFETYKNINKIISKDYKQVLKTYCNDSNAFLYLDPPYLNNKGGQNAKYDKGFNEEDIDDIFDFMDNCDCMVMLNVNYDKIYKEKVKEYKNTNIILKKCYSGNYSAKGGNKYKHCIITNY